MGILAWSALCACAGARPGFTVEPCACAEETFAWKGETGRCAAWGEAFAARLRVALARNGLVVAADAGMRVTGSVRFGSGETRKIALETCVTERGTGKVRGRDELALETEFFAVTNLTALVAATTEAAAQTVADRLAVRFRPFRIRARESDGRFVLGDGFGTLRVGECLTVFSPADPPAVLGTVQVVSVTPRAIHAVLVEREAAEIPLDSTLRRVPLRAGGKDR